MEMSWADSESPAHRTGTKAPKGAPAGQGTALLEATAIKQGGSHRARGRPAIMAGAGFETPMQPFSREQQENGNGGTASEQELCFLGTECWHASFSARSQQQATAPALQEPWASDSATVATWGENQWTALTHSFQQVSLRGAKKKNGTNKTDRTGTKPSHGGQGEGTRSNPCTRCPTLRHMSP